MPQPSPVLRPLLPGERRRRVRWGQLAGAGAALAVAEAARELAGPLLVVAPSPRLADQFLAELSFFAGDDLEVLGLPDSETLPWDVFSPHPDITSRRLAALYRMPQLDRGVVVAAAPTLLQRLPPCAWVAGNSLVMDVGERLDIAALRRRLDGAGYISVPQVTAHGEFAVRGSLVDVYPMGAELPLRLDLLDDEIESIRTFDPENQRSVARLDALRLLPAREFPFRKEDTEAFVERFRTRFETDLSRVQVYRDVADGIASGGIEYYLPLFFDGTADVADYLPDSATVLLLDDPVARLEQAWATIGERHEQLSHDIERPVLDPSEVYLAPGELVSALEQRPTIAVSRYELEIGPGARNARNFGVLPAPPMKLQSRASEPAAALRAFLTDFDGRVLFSAESPGRREALIELLADHGLRPHVYAGWHEFLAGDEPLGVAVCGLESAAVLESAGVAVLTEEHLFGERVRQRRRRTSARAPEAIIRQLSDLATGAPVVHEEYGIGRFIGLETLTVARHEGEFLTLEYAGGDKLYVPVQSLHLISRYTGASPETAPLHRLGSDQWQKARSRAAKRARDVAAELLDVYARRAARPGHTYLLNGPEYHAFCADFPFDETPDQATAIEAVVDDMTSAQPMDRLVCGDVGFGKTEVAMRAAFIATHGGRQVAVLVPTTLLAQQHYQRFADRFADSAVRVEQLSRFRTGKQTERILAGLADGSVDIVVGTHKLIQHTVGFKNLGLVVIDEEHRFGVRDKERLKKLRAEVDVLTLTATPIPRTLNMAMGGLRDLSLIATPPSERLAVKTFVSQWNSQVLREACLREIRRGGQVFFLHNKVQTIDAMAKKLEELVPEARIRVAHGQMREKELEQIMLDFNHRRFNVLVCTTIIESGIDIPTANTIIINRADKLGLAQLHQLRGRVGRSHHRAYAYLLAPPRSVMTPDAIKRLEAIESLEELGAGFTLATHDLEIRGAGELLGDEQSGQINEVGFTHFMELLQRAVNALREGREPELTKPLDHGTEVELGVVALLPEDYVPDVHQRLVLYKRITAAEDGDALRELQVELIDRFGLLPEAAKQLFRYAEVRLKASRLGVRRVEAGPAGGHLLFRDDTPVEPMALIRLIQADSRRWRLDGESKLRFNLDLADDERRFGAIHDLLDQLAPAPPAPDRPAPTQSDHDPGQRRTA